MKRVFSEESLSALFVLLLITGLLLGLSYSPTVSNAHTSVARLHLFPWTLIQSFHYWASSACILFAGTLLLFRLLSRKLDQARSFASFALVGLSFLFQVTGNLLPFDKHGVQTAAIEGGVAGRAPMVGKLATKLMLGSDAVSAITLSRWYLAHAALLPLLLGAMIVLLIRNRTKFQFNYLNLLVSGLVVLIAVVVSSPFGTAASSSDFTSYQALPSWYTLPMHSSLVLSNKLVGAGWIGAMLMPGLLMLLCLARIVFAEKFAVRLFAPTLSVLFIWFVVAVFGMSGDVASLTGTRDPVGETKVATDATLSQYDKALASRGRGIFNRLECVSCHGKDGAEPTGGPSLVNEPSKHQDAKFYIGFIRSPQSINPQSTMPGFPDLKEDELRAIAEFLRSPR